MRIIFYGTPFVAVECLAAFKDEVEVVAVVTMPDKLAGRKKELTPPPVKKYASEHLPAVPVFQFTTLKDGTAKAALEELGPVDLGVVCAYGKIMPMDIIELPKYDTINFHFSKLPRWRGASPVEAALLHGDPESAVCVQFINEGLDTGDILRSDNVAVDPNWNVAELFGALIEKMKAIIPGIAKSFAGGSPERFPQSEDGVTHCGKLTTDDGLLDWTLGRQDVHNRIRALSVRPGCFSFWRGKRFKFLRSYIPTAGITVEPVKPIKGSSVEPAGLTALLQSGNSIEMSEDIQAGTPLGVAGDKLIIYCGKPAKTVAAEDILLIDELQPEGKRRMNGTDFVNGQTPAWNEFFSRE